MGNFDWKIWAIKGLKDSGKMAGIAFLTAFTNYVDVTEFPPEYVLYVGVVVIVLNQILNFIKHTYLVTE
jgi:hypothetical protein